MAQGVAWALFNEMTSDWSQLRQIRRWPGQNSSLEKVPTELIYNGNTVQLWGAECKTLATQEERVKTKRLFKNAMSARDVGLAAYGHEIENARWYFKDFITHVHSHIEATLAKQINDFKKLSIEYVFSVPTTWNRDAETLNEVKQTTFLFSTHDPVVMGYARRLVRLVDGKISSDESTSATTESSERPDITASAKEG